jgi:hypothetical protein
MLNISLDNRLRFFVIISEACEKTRSEGVKVTGITRYYLANINNIGNLLLFNF